MVVASRPAGSPAAGTGPRAARRLLLVVAACSGDDDTGTATTARGAAAVAGDAARRRRRRRDGVDVAPARSPTTSALPVGTGELGVLDAALVARRHAGARGGALPRGRRLRADPRRHAGRGAAPRRRAGAAHRRSPTPTSCARTRRRARRDHRAAGHPAGRGRDLAGPRLAAAGGDRHRGVHEVRPGRRPAATADVPVTIARAALRRRAGPHNFSSPESHATAPCRSDGEVDPECRIRVNATSTLDAAADADPAFVATLAQEAFHCLQHARRRRSPSRRCGSSRARAAFAGEDVAGHAVSAAVVAAMDRRAAAPAGPPQLRRHRVLRHRRRDRRRLPVRRGAARGPERREHPPAARADRRVRPLGLALRHRPGVGAGVRVRRPGRGRPDRAAAAAHTDASTGRRSSSAAAMSELSAAPYRVTAPGDVLVVTTSAADRGALRFGDGQTALLAKAPPSRTACWPAGARAPASPPTACSITEAAAPTCSSASVRRRARPDAGRPLVGPVVPGGARAGPAGRRARPVPRQHWTSRSYVAPVTPAWSRPSPAGTARSIDFAADRTVRVDMSRDDARRHHRDQRRRVDVDDHAHVPRRRHGTWRRRRPGRRRGRRRHVDVRGAGAASSPSTGRSPSRTCRSPTCAWPTTPSCSAPAATRAPRCR